ncbi:MAG TPA: ATPase, T2SS/T4P/T4SS family [Terriglobia bacterium]|nr:ATPase, T2SS/T4P/T4SS family [Terriglobia bacterium]
MVVFCKRCGSPVKLENARLADAAYSVKCQQCQRPVAMDTVRPGARSAAPGRGATASPAGLPAEGTAGTAAARAAEESAEALDRNHYLQKIRLFSGLPYEECKLIESHLRTRDYAPQQTVVKEGGPGDAMFFITSGAVEVRKKDPHTGTDFLLSELKAGSCFGEMALLTGKPRVASVVAVEPTTCSVLEQSAFDEVLLTSSKVGLAMSRVLAERLDEANQQTASENLNLAKEEEQPREQTSAAAKSTAAVKTLESESPAAQSDSTESIIKSLQSEAQKSLEVDEEQSSPDKITDLSPSAEDAPIVRVVDSILALAIRKGASDIHLEPQEKDLTVRFRIDGALQVVEVLPKKIQMGLISRFKIFFKLDMAEKYLPQDGRITVRLEDRPMDFRVSTIPSKWGEKICVRILDKSNRLLGLDKLLLHQEVLELVREMISQPYGIIYITGPAGSGKTTSVYSVLAELNHPEVNICTAEDPIEYDLPGITQVQAHKEIGLDYPRILRALLSQNPDIIMVGETRDKETAHIAVEAALTRHLVFTTLHTHDAAGAFTRLAEMGVEPFLMSSSTIGIIAQRLLRRLCQACKETYTPDDISLKYMGLDPSKQFTFYRPRGCDNCSRTGYRGRVGAYEVLRMNAELRHLVASGGSSEAISALAIKNGLKTLKDYTVWLLQNGWTTMDEVLQVVSVQE